MFLKWINMYLNLKGINERMNMDDIYDAKCNILADTISSPNKSNYGLCSKCRFFRLRSTRYGNEYGWCREDWDQKRILPNKIDPITNCVDFHPKGQPLLNEMYDMAWLINRTIKNKIGFNSNDVEEYEISIKKASEKEKI